MRDLAGARKIQVCTTANAWIEPPLARAMTMWTEFPSRRYSFAGEKYTSEFISERGRKRSRRS